MKSRIIIGGALILAVLSGCGGQGQSSAEACELIPPSIEELSSALALVNEHIDDPILLQVAIENVLLTLDEQEELFQPRDPELAEAIQDGIDVNRAFWSTMQGVEAHEFDGVLFSSTHEKFKAAVGRQMSICLVALSSE